MSVPDLVRQRLDDEPVEATVSLGDDNELIVTPSRTMLYRGEGLIRDASIDVHSHDVEAVSVSEGRRKSTIRLEHGLDEDSEFAVPADRLDAILPAVLGGVLGRNGPLDDDESVREVFRLDELTLLVCDHRLIKHVGNGIWNQDSESFEFEAATGLDVEEGEVSSQIIVELAGRPERIKVPRDDARKIRERIEDALLDHHDLDSYAAFARLQQEEDPTQEDTTETAGNQQSPSAGAADGIEFGATIDSGSGDTLDLQSGDSSAVGPQSDIAAEVEALRETVERQNELLEAHERTIQQLIEELRGI